MQLNSKLDQSVNFITPYKTGNLEARYVSRDDDSFIIYLSSHSGCDLSCRMCHLTQTRQTDAYAANLEYYIKQVDDVMRYYDEYIFPKKKMVSYSFMARGDSFENNLILGDNTELFAYFKQEAGRRGLTYAIKLSTIMPKSMHATNLYDFIDDDYAVVYYSLYSINEQFRKKWLPKALPVTDSLRKLKELQDKKGNEIVIHFAFIAGENDSIMDMAAMSKALGQSGLSYRVNIVRYNPHESQSHTEPSLDVMERNMSFIEMFPGCESVQMIT